MGTSLPKTLGALVASMREAQGKTQRDMEDLTGVPRWKFSNLERGQGSMEQRMETLAAAASALGSSVEELLEAAKAADEHLPPDGAGYYDLEDAVKRTAAPPPMAGPKVAGIPDALETRMAELLEADVKEDTARTIARLANALENYERALLMRAQRLSGRF